jgi:hypothetical protein
VHGLAAGYALAAAPTTQHARLQPWLAGSPQRWFLGVPGSGRRQAEARQVPPSGTQRSLPGRPPHPGRNPGWWPHHGPRAAYNARLGSSGQDPAGHAATGSARALRTLKCR